MKDKSVYCLAKMAVWMQNVADVFLCSVEEENPEHWRAQARKTLQTVLDRKPNTNVAKNIILFLGDGTVHNLNLFPDLYCTCFSRDTVQTPKRSE